MTPLTLEQIAQVCHEANRTYCEFLGDSSQSSWDTAANWQRASCIGGVKHALEHPTATPAEMHGAWLGEKLSQGWTFGEKNAENKTHPCMMPYGDLPAEQRKKDALFLAIVRALS